MIRVDKFGGLVPKLNPQSLPDGAAQTAHNCDLTSGAIRPINITGTPSAMHSGGYLISGIPTDDVVRIDKPDPVTIASRAYKCHPEQWLTLAAHAWGMGYGVDGTYNKVHVYDSSISYTVTYTEEGLFLNATFALGPLGIATGGPYDLIAPTFEVLFTADAGGVYGGPDSTHHLPSVPSSGDSVLPTEKIPLIDTDGNVYAYWEFVDYDGQIFNTYQFYNNNTATNQWMQACECRMIVNLNYTQPRRLHRYYVQTACLSDTQEGPPSELSDEFIIKPGEVLTLATPRPDGYTLNKLYRSGTGKDDFLLIDDVNDDTFVDNNHPEQNVEIPPYGNFPEDTPGSGTPSAAVFCRGSVMHPAQFGIAAYDDTVYPTDFYRLHAFPDEYTIPFKADGGIMGTAIVGGTTIVFTVNGRVYGISGGNPAKLSNYLLSENAPLLNILGLCRYGDTIFWPTTSGLAACDGGKIDIITSEHMREEQWAFYTPASMVATTYDNCVHMDTTDGNGQTVGLRFDMSEKLAGVTTYTALTGVTATWKSKLYHFDQETIFDYVRVVSDGTTTLNVYTDGTLAATVSISDSEPVYIADQVAHAKDWEFEVETDSVVKSVELFERTVQSVKDEARFGPDTPLFKNCWFKYPAPDRPVAGMVSVQTSDVITLNLYADGSTSPTATIAVSNGAVFQIPETVTPGVLWRAELATSAHCEDLVLLARSVAETKDTIIETYSGGIPPWMLKKNVYVGKKRIKGIIVHTSESVDMRAYLDGATTPTYTTTIASGQEIRVEWPLCGSIVYDFNGEDSKVSEVMIMSVEPQLIGPDGISMMAPMSVRRNMGKFPDRGKFACGMIGASAYSSVTLNMYADGSLQSPSKAVTDGHMFSFPRTWPDAALWEWDVDSADAIESIILLPRVSVPIQGKSIHESNPGTIIPWLNRKYESGELETIKSFKVTCSANVTMRLYLDGSTSVSYSIPLVSGVEKVHTVAIPACRSIEWDFNGNDYKVQSVTIFLRDVQTIDENGINLSSMPSCRNNDFKFVDRGKFSCASVGASSYTGLSMTLTTDGGVAASPLSVTSGFGFLLPRSLPVSSGWRVDLSPATGAVVDSLSLLPRRPRPSGDLLKVISTGNMPPWFYEQYEFGKQTTILGVAVFADASAYPLTMNLYYNNGLTGNSETIASSAGTMLTVPTTCDSLEFDFAGQDDHVRAVTVYSATEQMIDDNGFNATNPEWARGIRVKFPDRSKFVVGSIGCTAYPVTLRLTDDDGVVTTQSVTDGHQFTLPRSMAESAAWIIDVEATGQVTSISLLPRTRQALGDKQLRRLSDDNRFAPWLRERYDVSDGMFLKSIIVKAESAVTMNLYGDGVDTASANYAIADSAEIRVGATSRYGDFDIDFGGNDHLVNEIILVGASEQLTQGPIQIAGGTSWRGNLFRYAEPTSMACGFVGASGTVTLKLYGDGYLVTTQTLTDGTPFILAPNSRKARLWEVDIAAAAGVEVRDATIYPWVRQGIQGQNLSVSAQPGTLPPWLYTIYEFDTPITLRSGMVKSNQFSKTLRLYTVIDSASYTSKSISSLDEFSISGVDPFQTLIINFGGDDDHVTEVQLFAQETIDVPAQGLILPIVTGTAAWKNKRLSFKDTGAFSVARVVATDYTGMYLDLYQGGTRTVHEAIASGKDFKLDTALDYSRDWDLELDHSGDIAQLVLIARQSYEIKKGFVKIRAQQDPWTWLAKEVTSPDPVGFVCARVVASAYPVTLVIATGGATKATITVNVSVAFRLPRLSKQRDWVFDVTYPDGVKVKELALSTSMEAMK